MNLAWLSTLRKVVETKSYTRAAEAMFMTQPAVSQQIRQLEKYFSTRLIQRAGREIELTEAGIEVYKLACLLETEVESTRRSVQELDSFGHRLVTLASAPTVLLHMLPETLDRFWAIHPEIEVRTMVRFGSDVTAAVKSGQADLGIHSAPYCDPDLKAVALRTREIICVCSPDHALAAKESVTPEDISRQRVAMTGLSTRNLVADWFAERDIILDNILEVSLQEEIRMMALRNLALGFASTASVAADLVSGRLVQLHLEDFHLASTYYVSHRSNVSTPAAWLLDSLAS